MRRIDADELKEWIKNWLYKDSYYYPRRRKETIPVSELYDVIDQVPTIDAETAINEDEREKMFTEIKYWMDLCKSYEQTIVKLSVALAERKEE